MAIDLLNLQPQMISKNLRGKYIMLYGLPGVGKTSLAAQFEKVLIAGFEMGTNALNNVYVAPIKTWDDWRKMVRDLCKNPELKEKFHAIAIDTVDEAWNLCTKYVCSQAGVESLSDVGFGKLYAEASKEFSQPFRDLAYNGYGLIFTSHSTEKEFKNEKGEKYTQIVPALQNRAFDIINKMVDIIAYIREISLEEGDKTIRKRFMFLRDEVGDRFLVKSRYRYIEPHIPLNYNALVDAIYKAIDEECSHSGGTATDDHNPYTTLNFDELIEEAKMLWGTVVQQNKVDAASEVLKSIFGKPTKFSEILPEDVEKLYQALIEIRGIL